MSKIRIKGDTSGYVDLEASATGNNLGIGTSNALKKLHVADAGDVHIALQSTNAADNSELFEIGAGANASNKVAFTFRTRLNSGSGGSEHMRIDNDGRITKPNQPAFLAKVNSNINNLSVNTASNVDIPITNEIFDLNNNFSSSTFTAPVTGKYVLGFHMRLDNIDASTTSYSFYLVTSNRTYSYIFDPDVGNDRLYSSPTLNILTDMDANDTAKMQYYVNAGAAQATLVNSTYFYGYLVA